MEDCHTDSELLTQFHKNTQQLRFSGFEGDWEEKKLGEIGETKSGIGFPDKEQGGKEGIPFFKVSDMNSDGNEYELTVANNYVTEEQINRNNWNIVKNVPAVFFAKVGAAVMLNRKRLIRTPFLLDNNTMAYIFDKTIWNCDFGKHLFETIDLTKLTQVEALPSYNGSDVENLQIYLPPTFAEQQKIGTFLSHVDSLIQAKTKKLESLKAVKKSLLQKCFPKAGEKVPEMRFAGFSGEWEEKKLGELAEISSGTTPSRMNSENFSGDVCWLTSGELKSHYIYDTSEKINESIAETMRTYKKGTVVIAIYGLEAAGIRGTCSILKRDCTISQACMAFTNLKSVHNEFLYCWYIANGNEIGTKYAQGTKQQNLSSDIVSDMSICFPTLAEQQKIGHFFSKYDSLISAQQKEIDKLKDIKKALLQKMFI